MTIAKIPVMEVFGPTIQGEGMVIGQKTMFIRTGGCDYQCSWCDSKFTWDGTEKAVMLPAQAVYEQLIFVAGGVNFNHVTISGGNPALIGEGMTDLINILHQEGIAVGLETQGSRWQDWFSGIDDLTISPKPPSSGMEPNMHTLSNIIERLNNRIKEGHVSLKIVIFDDTDYQFAKVLHKLFPHVLMYVSVGNADVTSLDSIDTLRTGLLEKLGWLFDKIIGDNEMNDVRPLPQLHTLVWGNRRAV